MNGLLNMQHLELDNNFVYQVSIPLKVMEKWQDDLSEQKN